MQQPDADLDAVLPVPVEEILAETPTEEVTGLTPEVSPYAYVAPPAAVLDASGRPPLLSAEKVNFAYGSVPVLFDVDVTVGEGELVAVLGPNGVGKTTLLRCLSGLEIPQQGVVRFNGQDVTRTAASKRVALGLSQIVGGNAVFGSLTVAENLQMYGYSAAKDRKAVQAGIQRAYEIFPRLSDRRSQLGSTLSGGEQQMLGLSKALILKPHLLVVDEFSLGLAPVVVGELLAMVRQLNAEGTAVLLVEQSVNVALNLVDRCYFMEKGRVVYEGRSEALRARPDLVQALSLGGLPHELEEHTV
jgi:ABC-type branched-subunit amino acid transport system ATPase component